MLIDMKARRDLRRFLVGFVLYIVCLIVVDWPWAHLALGVLHFPLWAYFAVVSPVSTLLWWIFMRPFTPWPWRRGQEGGGDDGAVS